MSFPATHALRTLALGLMLAVGPASLAVLPATTAVAQSEVLLTPEIVAALIASYPEVVATTKELEAQYGSTGTSDPAAALGALTAYPDAMGRLNATVTSHGFDDYLAWVGALTAMVTAYTFATEGGAVDEQMAQAIAEIEANPSLSAEQKTMMLEQMKAASASIAAMRPPQQNIDAVNAHGPEVKLLLEQM